MAKKVNLPCPRENKNPKKITWLKKVSLTCPSENENPQKLPCDQSTHFLEKRHVMWIKNHEKFDMANKK